MRGSALASRTEQHAISASHRWQSQLPSELALRIAQQLWYNSSASDSTRRRVALGSSIGSQFKQLDERQRSVMNTCKAWRTALLGEFSRYAIGDCTIDAAQAPHPFLSQAHTQELWLRFDGALLFGEWATTWTRSALENSGQCHVDTLVIVIVESPNTITTAAEDHRAMTLAQAILGTVRARRLWFLGQASVEYAPGVLHVGIGDKFVRLYTHMRSIDPHMHLTAFDQRHLSHDSAVWLIIRSAQTLEYLRVGSVRPSELQKIVSGASGEIVFPRMRECLLTLNVDDSKLKQFNITQSHFPALEFLHVAIPPSDVSPDHETTLSIFEHTFLADLFFFGSMTQLRVLNFPLAWDTVEVLGTSMLAKAQELVFPTICMENEHVLDNEESNQIMQACLAIRGLRTFCTDSACPQPSLQMVPQCSDLGILCVPSYAFTIDQISMLLTHLPKLYYFQCELALGCPGPVMLSSPHDAMLRFMLNIPFRPSQILSESIFSIISHLPRVLQVRLPFSLCRSLCEKIERDARESTYPWSRRIYENACVAPNSSS